ncbi:FG-GAP-like repeat-containing protein [Terricaulis sp.]|uniref:FG-GAP-like repeat-containing protein n=1 Tax=Terricaulis sp. TaxID=2768686 RepID=UPI0037836BC0
MPYSPITVSSLNASQSLVLNGPAGLSTLPEFGSQVTAAGDVNRDGYADVLINSSQSVYLVYGGPIGGVFDVDDIDGTNGTRFTDPQYMYHGASAGDVNGDGYIDIVLADTGTPPGGTLLAGRAFVMFGSAAGFGATFHTNDIVPETGFIIIGSQMYGNLGGQSVVGDINGDGYDDIAVAASGSGNGYLYIVYGHPGSFGLFVTTSMIGGVTAGTIIVGAVDSGFPGEGGMAIADINGDGRGDFFFGAANGPTPTEARGAAYGFYGTAAGLGASFTLSDPNGVNGFRMEGEANRDRMGTSVAVFGDVNGDGYNDFGFVANGVDFDGRDYAGSLYVVFGGVGGIPAQITPSDLDGTFGFRFDDDDGGPALGIGAVSAVGDFNGDGFDDIGMTTGNGVAYILFGRAGGFDARLTAPDIDGVNGVQLIVPSPYSGVWGVGDFNGDGLDDVAIDDPLAGNGQVTIVFGVLPDEAVTRSGSNIGQTIHGGDFADMLSGLGGNDVLVGHGGGDVLDGGAGIDFANYAIASTDASWSRNPDGTWTVTAEGVDTVSSVEFLRFSDRDVHLDAASRTFSGDGTSDILFRRDDGIMASWEVTGTTINSAAFLPAAGAEWTPLDTGDFNGDGRADVLWQRNDGLVYSWEMNGGAVSAVHALAGIGAEWTFLGAGDFDGDLTEDLAWRRDDGVIYQWRMQGGAIESAAVVAGLGADWSIQGFGDFNGDGRDDYLWRNASGQTVIWTMNGSTIAGSAQTSVQPAADWQIVGVGDTNADGYDDIILRHDGDGMVRVWSMNDATVTASTDIAAVDPAQWTIENIGDYNGDGRDDILWRNSDGVVYVWLLAGAAIIGAGGLSGIGPEWGVI